MGYGVIDHTISGTVKAERLRRIQEILNRLEHPEEGKKRIKPNWKSELEYVLGGGGEDIPTSVICDVYAEDTTRKLKYAFELKAPLPNSNQTKVSKEKILKLHSMEPLQIDGAYYALPYNPYDKLTVSSAHGQLISGGCFAIGLDRLRSRSAYQGQ